MSFNLNDVIFAMFSRLYEVFHVLGEFVLWKKTVNRKLKSEVNVNIGQMINWLITCIFVS